MLAQTIYSRVSLGRLLVLALVLTLPEARSLAAPQADKKGLLLSLGFAGNSDQAGRIFKLSDAVGYRFNKHFEVTAGLPVYFVMASSTGVTQGFVSNNGIGNAYLELRGLASNDDWYFSTTLRGSAPTGDSQKGFSTGRVTVDWSNYLERTIGRFTPFGNAGMGNTISDTHFFYRPFTTLGVVGHFEGGTNFQIFDPVSVGASVYSDVPKGEQKVFSKLIPRGQAGNPAKLGGHGRVFEIQSVVVGTADIARDHGVAGWLDLYPSSSLSLEIGYSRSMRFDYNTLFFSVDFDLGKLIRKSLQ
ncbi:MAG: hypothetical protein LAP85_27685 [Acidobacteriia bacterium]|nr:hypothetical protein [Terriglobia bacterium]